MGDGGPEAGNVHAAWRLAVARRAAGAYDRNPKLAALTAAGSVGAGLADEFSDLELDGYWHVAPGEEDRAGPVRALGGELTALYDYDEADEEWGEEYVLGPLHVTVSNFVTGTIDRFIDDVVLRADTDPVKHMRLAALLRSCPLVGEQIIVSWRDRAAVFPAELVSALVRDALAPEVLIDWAARDALVSRGDHLAVRDLATRAGQAAVRAVLTLNQIYLPHRILKWQRHLTGDLPIAPVRLAERLDTITNGPPRLAVTAAEGLLADTVLLAQAHTDADLRAFQQALAERRPVIRPPSTRSSGYPVGNGWNVPD